MPTTYHSLPIELKFQIWQEAFQSCFDELPDEFYPEVLFGCARMKYGIAIYASQWSGEYSDHEDSPQWLLDILRVDRVSRETTLDYLVDFNHNESRLEKIFEETVWSVKDYFAVYAEDRRGIPVSERYNDLDATHRKFLDHRSGSVRCFQPQMSI